MIGNNLPSYADFEGTESLSAQIKTKILVLGNLFAAIHKNNALQVEKNRYLNTLKDENCMQEKLYQNISGKGSVFFKDIVVKSYVKSRLGIKPFLTLRMKNITIIELFEIYSGHYEFEISNNVGIIKIMEPQGQPVIMLQRNAPQRKSERPEKRGV